MTFARYSRDLWAEEPAKVAKPAKDQQVQEVGPAKPLLMPAKVDASMPNLSQALAAPSPRKSAEDLGISQFSRFSRTTSTETPTSDRSALVRVWVIGVDRLLAMPQPENYPAHAWSNVIDDADQFLKRWADQAAGLAWKSWQIWGVHRDAPWYRIGAMGLVPSLHGRRLIALSTDAAVIETRTGNKLRYCRRPDDLLAPGERALIWELD